ncbi:MAG TPA: nitrogenase component 1 [Polyangia bacterium]
MSAAPEAPAGRGSLQGKTLVGGPKSRARLATLLGLDVEGTGGLSQVAAVAWAQDHLEVEVAGPGEQHVVFYLDRSRDDKPRLLANQHLVLYYRGGTMWPELEARLRRTGLRRLEGKTVEDLAALIASDDRVDPARDRPPRVDATDQQTFDRQSLLSTWASGDMWYQFFATAEIGRARLDSLDIFDRCTFIQHCDRDCLQVSPRTCVSMIERVFYPWYDRVRRIGRARDLAAPATIAPPGGPGNEARHSMCTTDIGESDVVMGSTDKLTGVLDHVLSRGVDNMLFLSCTCVPFMTGEDVESIVKRYRAKTDKPFFYLTTTPQSSAGVFREVLVRRRQAAEAQTPVADPHAVNLIGFARGPALEELKGLLGAAGVPVNAVFIPDMNFGAIADLPRAPLHIMYPNAAWQSIYDQLLFDSRIRSVAPAAPYGVTGTRRWVGEVAAAAGVAADAEAVVARAFAPHRAEWDELRGRAAEHRLGFVVGADEVYRLCDPAATWGVPLLSFAEEMGFAVDVMIGVGDREAAREAAAKVHGVFAEPPRHTIKAFRDPARLTALLASGTFAAVYSEHLFDRRLTAAGKAQFSLQEFEPGLAGAVRTARRLLTVCRLPFYRRYGRYLQPDPLPPDPLPPGGGRRGPSKLAGPGAAAEGRWA